MRDADGNSPLHLACKYSLLFTIKGYSSCHQLQGTLNSRYELPLHIACKSDDNIAAMNHVNNDDVNASDDEGNTPLCVAFEENHLDIVEFLLSKFSCDVSIEGGHGQLPLHMACSIKCMKLLESQIAELMIVCSINRQWTETLPCT